MKYIKSSYIRGIVEAPSSKSESIRAAMISLLFDNEFIIRNYSNCIDAQIAAELIKSLGKNLLRFGNAVKIKSTPKSSVPMFLNVGESALLARIAALFLTKRFDEFSLSGEGSLLRRRFEDIKQFEKYGLKISSSTFPLNISGKLIEKKQYEIDCKNTSQIVTGLIFLLVSKSINATIKVENAVSMSYIDLTINVLSELGAEIIRNDNFITINKTELNKNEIEIKSDWSSISHLFAVGIINGNIAIDKVNYNTNQADERILNISEFANCFIKDGNRLLVNKGVKSFELDCSESPDLFPALAAIACSTEGISKINGTNRLENKESNRAEVIKREFSKFGAKIEISGNEMIIEGTSNLMAATIEPEDDHRIAMASVALALKANGKSEIRDSNCVRKSYSKFWEDMKTLGANIDE